MYVSQKLSLNAQINAAMACLPDVLCDEVHSGVKVLLYAIYQTAMTANGNFEYMPDEQQDCMVRMALDCYHKEQAKVGLR